MVLCIDGLAAWGKKVLAHFGTRKIALDDSGVRSEYKVVRRKRKNADDSVRSKPAPSRFNTGETQCPDSPNPSCPSSPSSPSSPAWSSARSPRVAPQTCPVTGSCASNGAGCPLKHGTVWANPYPGYVHGRRPAMCKHGCQPSMKPHGDETPLARLLREAKEFQELFHREQGSPAGQLELRMAEIEAEVASTGTYTHTSQELQVGVRVGWRNAPKCANRKFWNTLEVLDRRSVTTNQGMFEACLEHLTRTARDGAGRAYVSVFPAQHPVTGCGPRVWSDQLIRFAGFQESGEIVGDPANLDFTTMVQTHFGWKPPSKGHFQVLPLVLQAAGEAPACFHIPESACSMVEIWHPDYPFLGDLQMKWCGVPAVSNIVLELGGLTYSAIPFNGWFADTEVVRNLSDANRYNRLPDIAKAMGLQMEHDSTLWKDEALVVLDKAVMHSFSHASLCMVDHHTMLEAFWHWYREELRLRGWCPGNWKWIIPPLAASSVKAYTGLSKMKEYTLKPMYIAGPGWRSFARELPEPSPTKARKQLGAALFALYICGKIRRKLRKMRRHLLAVYASANGTTKRFADLACVGLSRFAVVKLMDAETISSSTPAAFTEQLARADGLLVLTPSYGQGDIPAEACGFYQLLQGLSLARTPYAVLGFGNSDFADFCGAAAKFDALLAQQGGQQLCPVVRCDELRDRQATFDQGLIKVARAIGMATGDAGRIEKALGPLQPMTRCKVTLCFGKASETLQAEGLSRERFVEAVGVQVHPMEGDASQWASSCAPGKALVRLQLRSSVPYKPGDHLAVVPRGQQFAGVVESICRALRVRPDEVFVAYCEDLNKEKHPLLQQIQHKRTTMRSVLSQAALAESLSSSACRALSHFANGTDKKRLESQPVARELRWAFVFETFPSLRGQVPLEDFLLLLPASRARIYSIASSSYLVPRGEVHLLVSRSISEHGKGVASDDLTTLTPESSFMVQVRTCRSFHLPGDPRAPLLLVAGGSGLAPFRGFWQERMKLAQQGSTLGPAVLIYGCRYVPVWLQEELTAARQSGALSCVMYAVSSASPKVYVQDLIRRHRHQLAQFVDHSHCEVYLCGGARIVLAATRAFEDGAAAKVQAIQKDGRWHSEVFH
ncbi:unnamed protein product [Effrenium voratum]|nr:unnamed protein product [Effrenium voratum]